MSNRLEILSRQCRHNYVWDGDEPMVVCSHCGDMVDTRNGNLLGNVREKPKDLNGRSVYKSNRDHVDDLEDRLSQVFEHITDGRISKPYTDVRKVVQLSDDLRATALNEAYEEGFNAGKEAQ